MRRPWHPGSALTFDNKATLLPKWFMTNYIIQDKGFLYRRALYSSSWITQFSVFYSADTCFLLLLLTLKVLIKIYTTLSPVLLKDIHLNGQNNKLSCTHIFFSHLSFMFSLLTYVTNVIFFFQGNCVLWLPKVIKSSVNKQCWLFNNEDNDSHDRTLQTVCVLFWLTLTSSSRLLSPFPTKHFHCVVNSSHSEIFMSTNLYSEITIIFSPRFLFSCSSSLV